MLPQLKSSEAYWKLMKQGRDFKSPIRAPRVVKHLEPHASHNDSSSPHDLFDVIIAGGTLGIFIAAFLQKLGHSVCVIDKREVSGRRQEWNISRAELERGLLFHPGLLLSREELEKAIAISFNPVRVGFKGGGDNILVRDVLNLGICPRTLISIVRSKFVEAGGVIVEGCEFKSATLSKDRVVITALVQPRPQTQSQDESLEDQMDLTSRQRSPLTLHSRLLVDAMGHYSPIVQEMRRGRRPDGIVMVVGTCARGYAPESNTTADLLYSMDDGSKEGIQWFWEAFPARDQFKDEQPSSSDDTSTTAVSTSTARTTYMFGYMDDHPSRPSFEQVLDQYFKDLPRYQDTPLSSLTFKRVLFGAFPCFSDGPLQPGYDRIIQIGDASASQSTLSFGGFGSLMRHMERLVSSLSQALNEDRLERDHLSLIHPYQPSLASAWLFQRAMSLKVGQMVEAPALTVQGGEQSQSGGSIDGRKGLQPESGLVSSPSIPSWAKIPSSHINRVLATNFSVMRILGDEVLKPFLQDTIKFIPLCLTMSGMMIKSPLTILRVLIQLGPKILADWIKHYLSLLAYTICAVALKPLISISPGFIRDSYRVCRFMEALTYGSGLDHH